MLMSIIQNFYHEKKSYGLNLAFCGMEACVHGHIFGPAKRAHYLFHYILDGKGTYKVNDQIYTLSQGQGFMIFPGDTTIYSADNDQPWTYVWLAFDGPDTKNLLKQCAFSSKQHIYASDKFNQNHTIDNFSTLDAMAKTILRMVHATSNESSHYLHQLSRLYEIFAIMDSHTKEPPNLATNQVLEAIRFIESNYPYDIRVTDIAKAVMLERSYLYRQFVSETGLSPKDYLTNYRLNRAKELLQSDNESITEIAYTCGFKSSSAFYKHFRQRYDTTPKSYRENYDIHRKIN